MSTLAVGTIKSISSAAPVFQNTSGTEKGQLAKAWVNFNGTGTVAIRDDFNVSSISDNGTGDYTVNFSNSFSNANYCSPVSNGTTTGGRYGIIADSDSKGTDNARFLSFQTSSGSSLDAEEVSIAFFGDN
tara:strand:- start:257 stop:646 length:390 start_codon:yes stop_codon:yes gene_type:complete